LENLEQNLEDIQAGERIYPKSFNEAALDHKERYQLALNYIAPFSNVLDSATGVGYGAHYMAVNSRCNAVVGVDINLHALDWAKAYFASEKNEFIHADFMSDFRSSLPFNQFDVITCFETIEHLKDENIFLQTIKSLLKPGGLFLISSPNEEVIPCSQNPFYVGGKNPHHHRHYRPSELRHILNVSGFTIVDAYTQCPHKICRGENGFVIVYVCTNTAVENLSLMNPVELAIERLNILLMQNEFPFLQTAASASVNLTSIDHRLGEIIASNAQLMNVLASTTADTIAEHQNTLEEISKILCPESHLWLGMAHQTQGRLFKALESYSFILDNRHRTSQSVVRLADEQMLDVIKQLMPS